MEDTSPRFGCYGDGLARTPNLDALAAQGRRYTNAFCTAGVCAPSRASIITGCYATWLGAHQMRTTLERRGAHNGAYECVPPPYVKCFPEWLRGAGYFCTNNFKTDYQFTKPATAWDECDSSAHWRYRPDAEQPFFAVFNPILTHESGMWPVRGAGQDWDVEAVTDPADVTVPPWLPDTTLVRQALARHYDNIARSDQFLGELLAQLEADGLAQNTVVMAWSDHGEGLPRAKRTPYDSGINIPLLVRWPGEIAPGEVCDDLVSLIDLAPTLLSLADLEIPAHLQGQPFLGPQFKARQHVFAHRDRQDNAHDMRRAVRDQKWKYIRNYYPGMAVFNWEPYAEKHPAMQELRRLHREGALQGAARQLFEPRPAEELYDLENDPHELHNLAREPQHAPELERLRAALDEWRRDFDRFGEMDEWAMRNQMWPNGQQPQAESVDFIPSAPDFDRQEPLVEGRWDGPVVLQLQSPTQGASIAYALGDDETPRWQLYTIPFFLPAGVCQVRAKAIRIGWKESPVTSAIYEVL